MQQEENDTSARAQCGGKREYESKACITLYFQVIIQVFQSAATAFHFLYLIPVLLSLMARQIQRSAILIYPLRCKDGINRGSTRSLNLAFRKASRGLTIIWMHYLQNNEEQSSFPRSSTSSHPCLFP